MQKEKTECTCDIIQTDNRSTDLSFKVIVVGNAGVGKSSLTINSVHNAFCDNYNTTVCLEFYTKQYIINNKIVKLQIWDTCGQEIYRSIINNFYNSSGLAVLVYSINNKESFNNLKVWLSDVRQYAIPGIKILLVGNKYDLNNERVISFEMGERFKEENRLDYFVEASAKLGFNTEKIFKKAAMLLYRSYLEYKTDNTSIMTATFRAENNLSFTLTRPRIETKYSNEANKQKMNQINSNNTYDNQKCEC